MEGTVDTQFAGDIAAAFAWWREAGVDQAFADVPQQWLARSEAAAPAGEGAASGAAAPTPRQFVPPTPAAAAPLPKLGGEKAGWPTDLVTFQQWWLSEPSLDTSAERVAPRGIAYAKLMVLAEQPDAEDGDRLLSGSSAKLLSSMLAAMGLGEDEVYFASVLPRHMPFADWASLVSAGLADLLAHHINLAAPQRLLTFGTNIPPLIGNDPAQSAQSLRTFNHEGRTIPALAAPGLDALVRPRAKAQFWSRWLDWTETGSK